MATIKIKRGSSDPTASQVTNAGELAANISAPKIFLKTLDDNSTAPVWVGAQIENSPGDWTSAVKLPTQGAINTTFMPKAGGTFTGDVSLSGGSDIRFIETGGGTDYVALQAPSAVSTGNVTYTLPGAYPAANNYVLQSDTSGVMTWTGGVAASTATNLANGAAGSIPYQTGSSTTTFLSAGTSGDILTYGGSSAPVWSSGSGSGSPVRATSPTFGTSINGDATFAAFGSCTALTMGYSGTASSTTNISTGATGASNTNSINIGTAGAASSNTTVTIGSTSGTSNVYIKGNLQVDGTTTTLNTANLTVDDLNIIVGDGVTTAAGGDGAGLIVGTSGVTFTYNHTNTAWQSTENFNIASGKTYKINTTSVLSSSAVLGLSVTSGTISSGTWNGTTIAGGYGGTGQTTYTVGDLLYASGTSALSKLSSASTAGAVLASTGSASAPEYKTISFTNGNVSSGSGTLTLSVQNAAADGSTKGIAAFNSTSFSASSGVVDIAVVDGGNY